MPSSCTGWSSGWLPRDLSSWSTSPAKAFVVAPDAIPLTVGAGAGLDLACAPANRAGITITGLPG